MCLSTCTIPQLLAPYQLGFEIVGGVEAAVHVSKVYLNHLPSDKAMILLGSDGIGKATDKQAYNYMHTHAHLMELCPVSW